MCHSRSADAISSTMGCAAPDMVSSLDLRDGRGGNGFKLCDSVGDRDRTLAGYTWRPALDELAWSGGGPSLNDLRAVERSSSSSSTRGPGVLGLDASDMVRRVPFWKAAATSARLPSASGNSSRMKMCEPGKMPIKTC